MDNMVAVNDIIATRDNQRLRILRIRKNGEKILGIECVDDDDPRGPCRVNVTPDNFRTILKKSPWRIDPVTNRKFDSVTGKPWEQMEVKK